MTGDMDVIRNQMLTTKMKQIKRQADPEKEKALKDACEGFEAIFTKKMIESMRQTLPGDSLFPKSNSIEIFESMYDQHLAEDMADSPSGSGLKEYLYNQLKATL